MSPQSLAEDLNEMDDGDATKTQTAPDAATPAATIRPRIPTRDLLAAIQQARRTAGLHGETAEARPSTAGGDSHGIRAGQPDDASEGNLPVTPPSPGANGLATDLPARPASPDPSDPWLPERDGPVTLAGVAAPRTHIRAVRRAVATPDKAARRPGRERRPSPPTRTPPLDPDVAAVAAKSPPRLIVVAACGGAGATTLTVLMAAALAAQPGALVVTAGPDRGALSARSSAAAGGDPAALADWARQHPRAGLQPATPGLASGDAGTGPMVLATPSRHVAGTHLDATDATAVLAAAAKSSSAVIVDWRCALPLPERLWSVATHVLVVAPYTTLGLLDAEYTVQAIESAAPDGAALSVAAVDVSGGGPRRGRAALARLRAHGVPVTTVARDPTLAADPQVHWPSLRPRTRAAVTATLTQALRAGSTHHLTSERNAP